MMADGDDSRESILLLLLPIVMTITFLLLSITKGGDNGETEGTTIFTGRAGRDEVGEGREMGRGGG